MSSTLNQIVPVVVAFTILSVGCLTGGGSDEATTTPEPTPSIMDPPVDSFAYRLVIAPMGDANTTAHVELVNRSADDAVVFDERLTVDREHDLSHYFDSDSSYRVTVRTNGHTDTYGIADFEGYKLFVNESGVVYVEQLVS